MSATTGSSTAGCSAAGAVATTTGTTAGHRGRWAVGGAIAAGLVLVVGTVTVLRPGNDSPVLAQARPAVGPVVVATAPAAEQSVVEEPVVADVRMIRDAQLDRYLTAHKQFAGTSALGVPSAFLRSATLDTASR